MLKLPLSSKRASEETVKVLVSIGALYVDEKGIHASEPGIYTAKENIPANGR